MAILGLWAVFGPPVTAAQAPSKEDLGRYIITLKDSVEHPGERARAQTEQRDGKLGFVYRHAFNGYSAELPKGTVEALEKNPSVLSVEPDVRVVAASQTVPTGIDRIFATNNAALDIDEADDQRIDVDVALLDSGIDAKHPDLDVVSQVDCTWSFPCESGGTDGTGHGTHVAGTIGAIDNGEGVVGVAPGARLWSVKVLGDYGSGFLSGYIAGIDWVTANASEIEVANSSIETISASSEAFDKAIEGSLDAGVVHVVAAGNKAETVQYLPANNPDVITVSALGDADGLPEAKGVKDQLSAFSNFGSVVDVAAPGNAILSTLPSNGYGIKYGTSMASPHVAGAAALLASMSNPESREDVEGIRDQIVERGNFDWIDNSKDGAHEPLLDLSEPLAFPFAPSVTTKAATSVKANEATLNATVNPGGLATTYQLEYGTTTSYGSKIPLSAKSIGSGASSVAVSETVSGLSKGTTYHYRVVATNELGSTYGADKTLTTLSAPTAITQAATNIRATGARLNATVNPGGATTTYQLEYGTTTSYGSKIPLSPKSIGSGASPVSVSQTVSGLSEATTYHYRVVATNELDTTYGADKTLTTTVGGETIAGIAFTGAFGSEGAGEGEFANPSGIAIDSSDNVLVADTNNNRIQVLDSEGEYLSQFGASKLSTPSDVAIDSNGNILVADVGHHRIAVFNPQGKALGNFGSEGSGNGQFKEPAGIAVDSNGHIWVLDPYNHRVQEFNAEGEYLSQFGSYGSGNGQFYWLPTGIAIDSNDHIWVGEETHRVQEFNATGEYLSQFGSFGSGNGQFAGPLTLAIDSYDHIWVSDWDNHRVQEFDAEGEYLSQFGAEGSGEGQFSYPAGIAIDSAEHIWVADNGNSRIQRWMTPEAPTATTKVATSVKAGEATLNATVNPGGLATTYQFEYGTTTSYGSKIPLSPKSIGSGASSVAVSETVSGLSKGTTYHYRVVATNELGSTYGADEALTTPEAPTATTEAATNVKANEARLNATVNPGGATTTYQFEYGTTTSYGTKIPLSAKSIGSGTSPVSVSQTPDGLSTGTTYHYRVVATNELGTTYGADKTLTTAMSDFAFTGAFGSEGSGNGQFYNPAGIAIDNGDVFVVDTYNHRIQEFDAEGEYVDDFGSAKLSNPSDVAVTSYGEILVADAGNKRIQRFSTGEYVGQFGSQGTGNGQFQEPTSIAVDSNGHIWVLDSYGCRVQEFNPEGEYLSQFGSCGSGKSQFYWRPTSIAIDSNDHIWVGEESDRVQEFNPEGEYLSQFGSFGTGNGQFSGALTLAIDSNDHIWVSDWDNNRVQEFNAKGEYLSQFGSEGSGEGQFYNPAGIAVDSNEQIWVSDFYNNRIQRWSLTP